MEALYEPQTLQEAILYFSIPENCLKYLVLRRAEWKDGVTCPTCGSDKVGFLKNQLRWQCGNRHPKRQFSVKVGTIMEDSPIGLEKWLPATWMILNCKNGISSCEIARALGVTQKTAWFMLHRIRLAQQGSNGGKLGGNGGVEIDETFIGGKARNMHKAKRDRVITGTGGKDKTIVVGMLERGGNVRAMVVDTRKKHELQKQVREHVEAGAAIFTDELKSYNGLESDYQHAVINHAVEYVNENVHTNGMENFWSLLKRGLHGTYISVEPFHLFRYVDEQAFRFNNRKMTDAERFDVGVRQIVGKRLTYAELTGKSASDTETIN
jgi:transposase-like protein